MKPITFAVCGYGRIGKRHARIIEGFDGSRLSALIDPRPETGEEAAQNGLDIPDCRTLADFIEADERETDVINICTPNGLHAPLAIEALEANYHVVIEKPMALSRADCEKVIQASEEHNRQVFVVKQNRYSPTSQWLKEIVENRRLGEINLVRISCYWNRDERYYTPKDWHGTLELDGGTLFTQFSHFIDIMNWIFGDIENITARFTNFNHGDMIEFEDTGTAQFDFKRGGQGILDYTISCWERNMESSITVIGSKGSVKVGGQYMNEIAYCHIKDYKMPDLPDTNPPNDYGPYQGSAANHHYVIQNVVETLKGNETSATNAREGMKVVDIIERIYRQRSL